MTPAPSTITVRTVCPRDRGWRTRRDARVTVVRDYLRSMPVFSRVISEFDPDTAPDDPAPLFTPMAARSRRGRCPRTTRDDSVHL
jgi:hypothetical protein